MNSLIRIDKFNDLLLSLLQLYSEHSQQLRDYYWLRSALFVEWVDA